MNGEFNETRICQHSLGVEGKVKIEARTAEGFVAGISQFLKRYPHNPYGTYIHSAGKVDGMLYVYIHHFGAD